MSLNPFEMRWVENYRSKLHQHRASIDSYYKGEEIALKARYSAELEQYRAHTARDIEQYRSSAAQDLENLRHRNHSDIEEKRGVLSRWIAEFQGKSAKELEEQKQTGAFTLQKSGQMGALSLQEREHVHRRALLELDIAENRLAADNDHARALELAKKTSELAQFRGDREAIYALEMRRFDGIVSERQATHTATLAEFAIRSQTGQSVVAATASIVTTSIQGNQKLNEKLFDAIAGALARKAAHREKLEELEKRAELGISSEIDRFKKENGL
jgi:hypothetical protein